MKRTRAILALLVLAGLTAGCVGLRPQPDGNRYYLLAGPDPESPAADGIRIALRILPLPAYLRRPEVAMRQGPAEVVYLEGHRWAEALDTAFARGLSQHLRHQPTVREAVPSPFSQSGEFDQTVIVRVNAFQGHGDGTVRLDADWQVAPGGPANRGAWRGAWTPGDVPGLVAELSALTGRLAAAIAADLPPRP